MKRQRIRNRTPQSTKPHYKHHLARDLVLPKPVDQNRQWEYIARPSNQTQNQTPHRQRGLHLVLEAEQRQTQVRENARFRNESDRSQRLLHRDLCDRR